MNRTEFQARARKGRGLFLFVASRLRRGALVTKSTVALSERAPV